jgi:hypothetical protein
MNHLSESSITGRRIGLKNKYATLLQVNTRAEKGTQMKNI